jgi:hypothetical protein
MERPETHQSFLMILGNDGGTLSSSMNRERGER